MRKKQRPHPAKRRRHWRFYEWFISHLDQPYFSHSEFRDVIIYDMGLSPLLINGTREQWARARAAMCNALPVGFATPRRLSHAFLRSEREELAQYRDDARCMLRNEPLLGGNDVATGMPLPPQWWTRRRCPPPKALQDGERVLVRRGCDVCEGNFMGLLGKDEMRVGLEGETVIVSDLDVMGVEEAVDGIPMPPMHVLQSPRGALSVSPRKTNDGVECEVDVALLAKSIRLLDQKKELLVEFKVLNDAIANGAYPDEGIQGRYVAIRSALHAIGNELKEVLPQELPRENSLLASPGLVTPSPKRPRQFYMPQLPPEHLAKNVNFRHAVGTAQLAKALTKDELGKMGPGSGLKELPMPIRADMMECVSTCVAVLVRARATKDYRCIEEVVEGIRLRYPENEEARDAIHAAARTYETATSESS